MNNELDQHNKGGLWALLFSVVFCIGFFIYLSVLHPGIDLKEVAPEEETAAPKINLAAIEKPWEENADLVTHGASVYKTNCAMCHGESGAGDGPAGKALVPPPRNFVLGDWKQGGDSINLYKTISDGIPGTSMAAFKHLPKVDRWALTQYIRSITRNKVNDDPAALEKFAASAE